jgi:hypothetical protein
MFTLSEVMPGEDTIIIAVSEDPAKLMNFDLVLAHNDSVFTMVKSRKWQKVSENYWELRNEDASEMARWRTYYSVGEVLLIK